MEWLTYRLWLFFGGRRSEEGFRFLCKSVENNRKLLSEQSSIIKELEIRLWELENHSPKETLAEASRRVGIWSDAVTMATDKN